MSESESNKVTLRLTELQKLRLLEKEIENQLRAIKGARLEVQALIREAEQS